MNAEIEKDPVFWLSVDVPVSCWKPVMPKLLWMKCHCNYTKFLIVFFSCRIFFFLVFLSFWPASSVW